MKYLLHIDTATDTGTIALAGDGNILATRSNTEMRNHAATINIMIQDVLAEAGSSLQCIDAVAICGGPGSYTGLRIGMATAKGLCYALDKPLIATDRLTLLAYNTWLKNGKEGVKYISLITAREKEYFIAIYDQDFAIILPPQHILEQQLKDMVANIACAFIIGDAPSEIINTLNIKELKTVPTTIIDNSAWAEYAFEQFNCNNIVNLATTEPFYLKQVYTHK
ncbi:MAG: tsaB [Flavipsychrobacter sp.]|nr:tsaB [Flavipsychrobacter sp.]